MGGRRPQRPYLKGRTVSDIKLFRVGDGGLDELQGTFVAVEKSLQVLIEKHLQELLGVRFLASEYSTGKTP